MILQRMVLGVNLGSRRQRLTRVQTVQFIVRLSTYQIRWLELSKTEDTFEGLKELKNNSCPKELVVHLLERAPETLEEMAKIVYQYLVAHGKTTK